MELKSPGSLSDWLRIYFCYREAFPRSERKPFRIIVKMYRKGKTDIWCGKQGGIFTGFAATVNGGSLILLDYFAVERRFRGKGFGTRLLMQLQALYGDRGLFVEIEKTCPQAPNALQREKRKQFYIRCDMEPLGVQASVFGVEMELLGSRCAMTFDEYRAFYGDQYSAWAAGHIKRIGEE